MAFDDPRLLSDEDPGDGASRWWDQFPARLTGRTLTAGVWYYSWVEQQVNPSGGAFSDAGPARRGSFTIAAARERNNRPVDVTGEPYVLMRFRSIVGGQPQYDFDDGSADTSIGRVTTLITARSGTTPGVGLVQRELLSSGILLADADESPITVYSAATETIAVDTKVRLLRDPFSGTWWATPVDGWPYTLTVEEVDGTPSYTDITKIRFGQIDGFVLSQPEAGVVRADMAHAGISQRGIVNTTTQSFGGVKTFENTTNFIDGIYVSGGNLITLVGVKFGGSNRAESWHTTGGGKPFVIDSGDARLGWQLTQSGHPNAYAFFELYATGSTRSGRFALAYDFAAGAADMAYCVMDIGGVNRVGVTGTGGGGDTVIGGIITMLGSGPASVTWSIVTGTPTTLAGYGITDGATDAELTAAISALSSVYQPLAANLTDLAALSGTDVVYYRSSGGTWDPVTIGAGLDFTAGSLTTTGHAHAGEDITSGTVADARIAATIARDSEVSSAISALSSVYQPLDSDLTAIAALTTTSFGRALLELADAAAGRTTLGLGTAALEDIGTSGANVPLLSTANTFSAAQEIANASGGSTPGNYLRITGSIADNSNYPAIEFVGGTLATTYPYMVLSDGGLGLAIYSGKSATYPTSVAMSVDSAVGVTFVIGATSVMCLEPNGSLRVGPSATPTGGGMPTLALTQASGNPTGIASNTAGLVGKDVAGTCELFAWDEAGNVTQISPHAMDGPSWLYDLDDPLPRVTKEENVYLGVVRWTNESRAAALLARLIAGENLSALPAQQRQCVHVLALPTRRNWAADQAALATRRVAEIAAQDVRREKAQQRHDAWEALPPEERAKVREPAPFDEPTLAPHVTKPVPPFIRNRLAR